MLRHEPTFIAELVPPDDVICIECDQPWPCQSSTNGGTMNYTVTCCANCTSTDDAITKERDRISAALVHALRTLSDDRGDYHVVVSLSEALKIVEAK